MGNYRPEPFTSKALGFYDAFYGRPRNEGCVPEGQERQDYLAGWNSGWAERAAEREGRTNVED